MTRQYIKRAFAGFFFFFTLRLAWSEWNMPDPAKLEVMRERLVAALNKIDLLDTRYEWTDGVTKITTQLMWNIPKRHAVFLVLGEGDEQETGLVMTWPDGSGELEMYLMGEDTNVHASWRMENILENPDTLPGVLAFMLKNIGAVSDYRDIMDVHAWQPSVNMAIQGNRVELSLGFGTTSGPSRASWLTPRMFAAIREAKEDAETLSFRLESGKTFVVCRETGLVVEMTGTFEDEDGTKKSIVVRRIDKREVDPTANLVDWAPFLREKEFEELPPSAMNNMMGNLVLRILSCVADDHKRDTDPEVMKSLNERIRARARDKFQPLALSVIQPADVDGFYNRVLKPQYEAATRGLPFHLWQKEKTFAREWQDPENIPQAFVETPKGREFERGVTRQFEGAMQIVDIDVAIPLRLLMRDHLDAFLQGAHEAYFQAHVEMVLERLASEDHINRTP